MAGRSALSRRKQLLTCFDHIDAAIEAAHPSVSRDEFRRLRARIVELLCAVEGDDGKAEGLCHILDKVMEESLATLQAVPAEVVPRILESSADLAKAVAALRSHESERVRGLARDIIRRWKASVQDEFATVSAAMDKLDALSQLLLPENTASRVSGGSISNASSTLDAKKNQAKILAGKPCPTKTAPVAEIQQGQPRPKKTAAAIVGEGRVKAAEASVPLPKKTTPAARPANTEASTRILESLPKKTTPPVVRRAVEDHVMRPSPEAKMEAAKRRLHECYQEAADAKRQRRIQVIEAPKMVEQRQRKMHPIMRERSQARCGSSMAVRRSLVPAFHRV